jgi:glucan phosphoethanolaminetransferase (alkaline phosphatase superfamily)
MFKLQLCKPLPFYPILSELKFLIHWRSLMLLAFGVCLPLTIFATLATEIVKVNAGLSWELPILSVINQVAQPQLDLLAAYLTPLGVFWGVFPIFVAIALILLKRQQWRSLFYWFTALLGSVEINHTAKAFFHRVRPHLWKSFYAPDRVMPCLV